MAGQGFGRLLAGLLLALGVALFLLVLVNIPEWYRSEGLPLFPALLAAQAMVLAACLCAYGMYAIFLAPVLGRKKLERLRGRSTALPWEHNPQWVHKRITHTSIGIALFLWFFAVNWWGALWFFATDRAEQIADATVTELLLFGALVLIGLITVRFAVSKTVEGLRYGRSALIIETLPGRPGQTFMGRIETGFTARPRHPIELTLTGFTRHWSEQAYIPHEENRRVSDVRTSAPFHETSQKISSAQLLETAGRVAIPVRFKIPRDAPSSGPVDRDMEVVWKISARMAGRKGPAYTSAFEIPIFNT